MSNFAFRSIIFGLGSLFAVGIIQYFVVETAIVGYLAPILIDYITTQSTILPATQTAILEQYDKIIFFLRLTPYVLWLVILIWWTVIAFRQESQEVQYV